MPLLWPYVRRSLRTGPNLDLITSVDLNNRKGQEPTKLHRQALRTRGSNGINMWPFRTHGQIRQTRHP